ncbi:MAG: GAF domain-containing protein [Acidobacteriia bacterium]|nr:GAF domain-containing protein [Terriglobia bacterium]
MNLSELSALWDQSGPALELLANCSGVLILLAASFLVFRTFRERYLLPWILGWSCYLVYRMATGSYLLLTPPHWLIAVSQCAFVCAVALFVASILCYIDRMDFLLPLAVTAMIAVAVAVVRAIWWPNSALLLLIVRGLYTVMAAAGGVGLAVYSRGRRQVGPWVIMAMLLLLHLDQDATSPHFLFGIDLAIELLLGLGMLAVVLDDSKQRTDRLSALNVLSSALATAQEQGSMVLTALEQLKNSTGARAAWFRVLEGDYMVLTRHIDLSEKFIRQRPTLDVRTADGARIVQQGEPTIIRLAALEPDNRRLVGEEGFNHILVIPVRGKTSVIGAIALGQARSRSYMRDELDFLTSTGHQVGLALENLRLVEEITRSHRQWISTFDSIEDIVLVHDADFRILKLNRAVLQRLGDGVGDVVYQRCDQVLPGAPTRWRQCPYCEHPRANFDEGPDLCFGGLSMVSTSSYTEGGALQGTIHVVRDTTERRAAEERYRLLFEQAQEGVFVTTPEGRVIDCNDAFVRMLGYQRREEVLALDLARDLYLSKAQRQAFCEIMNERGFVRNYEVDLRRRDGSVLNALEHSFATRDASGKVDRFQGFLLDITEKRRAEDEIRRHNRELGALNAVAMITSQSFDLDEILNTALRHVMELFSADVGSVYLMDKGNVLDRRASKGHRNRLAATQLELAPEFMQQLRQSRREVLTHEDLELLPEVVGRYIRSEGLRRWIWAVMWTNDAAMGVLSIASRDEELHFSETDQRLMVAIARQLAMTIEKVRLYEETCRAYDNLRRTQEQLLQSEKMSAIGQLISGVAHEINNPLTAILGYAQLLENEALDARALDFVAKLFKQAQRTQRLVQNLLSFARQRKPEKKEVDIRKVLDDTLALRDYDLTRHDIHVVCDLEDSLPAVVADAHQIEQVFLNIINNAVDAMLERTRGGTLSVRTGRQNGHVCIEFRDSGPGIREPQKVFDPFYTTKPVGKGTGLGLSICYGIVKEHGGDIVALNHPDGGALFRVMLPATQSVPAQAPRKVPPRLPPLSGRILLVDEEAVLEFEREALAGAGAEVVAVSDGDQAIERLQAEKFDAMLFGVSLPGRWTGIDLYRWVAANLPGAEKSVILATSEIRDSQTRSFLAQACIPCIVKPFQVADLIAVTRPLLTRSPGSAAN